LISGNTKKDIIQNEEILLIIRVTPIDEKMKENHLRWFGHVQKRAINAPVKKSELIQVDRMKKDRGRPKITLIEVVKK
jgi:hypothetical protein